MVIVRRDQIIRSESSVIQKFRFWGVGNVMGMMARKWMAWFALAAFVARASCTTTVQEPIEAVRVVHATPHQDFGAAEGSPLDRRKHDEALELFVNAQLERAQGDFEKADALYEASLERENGNAPCARLWAAYQHGDLLMRRYTILVDSEDTPTRIKQAKSKTVSLFKIALSAIKACTDVGGGSMTTFGPAERLHALNSMGLLLLDLASTDQAIAYLHEAHQVNTSVPEPIGNLVLAYSKAGNLKEALRWNKRVLALIPNNLRVLHNSGAIAYESGDQQLAIKYWQQVLRIDPNTTQTLTSLAAVYGLLGDAPTAKAYLDRAVETSLPGPVRNSIRVQQAMSHLKMMYDSTKDLLESRARFEAGIRELVAERIMLPDPMITVGSGSMGYYAVYHGFNDRTVRLHLAQLYRYGAAHELAFSAPHIATGRHHQHVFQPGQDAVLPPPYQVHDRRIRIGFHSAFLRHHSAGLLLSGVIRSLDRTKFQVIVIIYETSERDYLTDQVLKAADQVVRLPQYDLQDAQRRVAELELDVLVFSEIGMDAATYFLAFARLALRTVSFWGHAVTSGIDTIDYFVSSRLFNRDLENPDDHKRYTECLYDMEGLSTMFPRPSAPQQGLSRASFQLPSTEAIPHLVLVPQTLYKLHPAFDAVLQRVLSAVATSILVLPVGDKPRLVAALTRRWRRGGVISQDVYRRIYFVRKMNHTEFLALCAMADVVLDPFPLGGGRSSFEIFSVGTPILGITTRTTVLQLTLGFYRRMGIDPSCCMVETEDELVTQTVLLLNNATERLKLRREIMHHRHKLYEASNEGVVREWEDFFKQVLAAPPPQRAHVDDECAVRRSSEPRRPRVQYTLSVAGDVAASHTDSIHDHVRTLQLFEGDDPFQVAARVTSDILQTAFTAKVLWNFQQRFRHRIITAFPLHIAGVPRPIQLEIREGDDLHQVVASQIKQHIPRDPRVDKIIAQAIALTSGRVPQHASASWRAARAMTPHRVFPIAPPGSRDCTALVITTCKRLDLFVRTVASLQRALGITDDTQWQHHFCSVVVVDDNSSMEDRQAMQRLFPPFTFYFKAAEEKGHARSLNIALGLVGDARFVLYLEDDWEFRPTASDSFLTDATSILKATSLVQVLLNDQHGGWPSSVMLDSHHSLDFAVHEFGILDPAHSFSYWPGFSLNPGVWDLSKLRDVFAFHHGDEWFREDTDIFEREFSLDVWREGLQVGFRVHYTVCDHIGAPPGSNASAYVLNGLPRRFD